MELRGGMTMLDQLFRPRWAGGWTLARWLFGVAMIVAHLDRRQQIDDALGHPDLVLGSGALRISDVVLLSGSQADLLWLGGWVGIALWYIGGRLSLVGLFWWIGCYYGLVMGLGLSARVPERMFLLVGASFLFGPTRELVLTRKWRGPAARWYLLLLACALYGSTGWLKLTQEDAWLAGEALPFDLVDRYFGLQPLGIFVSGQPEMAKAMSWFTIAFEAGFPLLIWWRRSAVPLLIVGVSMHVGIEVLMDVGVLTWITLAMYPVLLPPETAERWFRAIEPWVPPQLLPDPV